RGCSFTRGRREDRRITQSEPVVIQEIPDRLDDCVPDLQHRMLPARAQPQVPVVHEKLSTVFLRSDRVVVNLLQDFGISHVYLKTTGRATVFAYRSFDRERRLLSESF